MLKNIKAIVMGYTVFKVIITTDKNICCKYFHLYENALKFKNIFVNQGDCDIDFEGYCVYRRNWVGFFYLYRSLYAFMDTTTLTRKVEKIDMDYISGGAQL